ncbi:sensor domain-containing diguanylate cyclase (plasmid) [Acinetobacter haemolyticus]|uniref:sensor domain-containing diguanylate cyclase n=1 Tax=Acinetobacter sp. YH01022 TaxID=2601036 RepID=UPI0015D2E3FB|nr:sensor domain-containing diguanylate cyclase [Acinetobacter sp. YH01022]UDM39708.1 sensor domain-containing diguanylate cyclase [Acinetobacter haemolyticus]
MKQILLALKLNLRKLILISTILSVSCLFIVSVFILNYVIKDQLIQNSLLVNVKYASKVANSADQHFDDMLKELKYSAELLGQDFSNPQLIQEEAKRLKHQSNKFNSVLVVDKQSRVISFAPRSLNLSPHILYKTVGITESLKHKSTYISPPYWSVKHNLIVLLSQPIYDRNKKYQGMVGGTIYLQKNNLIQKMLSTEYDFKKSYMYVIDQDNRIIFHPDPSRIGEKIINNTGLDYMIRTRMGSVRLINSRGIENLAGFAYIPSVNWIVVSQQPTEELFRQANVILLKVSVGILIFYIFIFIIVWRMSRFISSPLNSLAKMASMLNQPDIQENIKQVDPWYFEVLKFRTSLLLSSQTFSEKIAELRQHVNTDPLTGLYNRRGMQIFLKEVMNLGRDFTVLAIDIDYFKQVNDRYGHGQGDAVLKTLASLMKNNFRDEDICCRIGGEEFIVLMTTSDTKVAYNAAERLRKTIESSNFNFIEPITISVGIAFWPKSSDDVTEVFKMADNKLYQAKNNGRNCICY